ncbi:MAG: molybdopterin-dependent oxidoreductase [Chloroflexi bacterium]|nr:molybdopterin-dependent oxidoreductase [Chloroflexota bacterium]
MMSSATPPKRPGLIAALAVGSLIALPVIALFFAANALFRLPLLPINVMDWLPNNLPNALLNAGKDAMVAILTAISPGDVDGVAKTAEGIIGTATLFGVIVVAVAAIFLIARAQKSATAGAVTGLVVGLVLGIVFALMYFSLPVVQFERSAYFFVDGIFIIAVFVVAGFAAGRISDQLTGIPLTTAVPESAAAQPEVSYQQLNRRQFLVRVGGTTATLTVGGAVVSLLARDSGGSEEVVEPLNTDQSLPADPVESVMLDGDFAPAAGTRPEYTPLEEHYRIDIVARPPEIDATTWTLPLVGLVNAPQNFTLSQLREMPSFERIVTMSCISNSVGGDLISTTKWTGVRMQDLVALADPQPEATYLRITCADGFDEYVSLDLIREDDRIMMAYAWDDRPLLQKHGFPVRIHIPNHYGMKQPKWITNIEFVPEWEEGYWVRRGWSATAHVQHTSVIDAVAAQETFERDGVTYIPLGGIAYSGDRGISSVEVSVDGGNWQPAVLKEPLGDNAWYLWRFDWPFTEGAHAFEVRCMDGDGARQRTDVTPQRPDGATGIHRVSRIL